MNRENTGAKPTAPPRLPPEAEQEILEALFEGMEIHSSEIAAILKKHGVCGDVEALQDSYRKRLGQRLMASLRDEGGKREVLANGKGSYVVLEGCGDRRQLEQIAPKLDPGGFKLYFTAKRMTGFDLYGQFPYEDARGMFEMMNGHQLMRYLLADQFHAVRWEIVPGTCYERAVLLPLDRTTPAYRAFEQKLYTAVLHDYHLNPQKQHDRKEHSTR